MKTHTIQSKTRPSLLLLALGLALLGPAGAARADDILFGFDTDISALGFQQWRGFGYVTSGTVEWDGSQDAATNASSGSLYITADWPQTGWDTGWHDIQFYFNTPSPVTPADYLTLEADIKIDVTNSSLATTSGTDYGISGLYLSGGSNPGWQQVQGYRILNATDGWQHISGSLAGFPGSNYTAMVVGLISQSTHTLTNTVRYWIDNVRITAPPSENTNRPAIAIAKAPPAGLTCMASAPTDPWQRQMVRTVNSSYSWHTTSAASNTTTYAITVGDLPGGAQSGFEAVMHLIPEAGMSNPDGPSVDWDAAHVAYLTITANGNGTANGNFRYKVNSAGAENYQTSTNHNCATGPVGTWQLSFNNDTNVTMTAPDGTSTSLTIPDTDAVNFQGNLIAYFGSRPNTLTRIGQAATFSRIKITGAAATIDDTFVSSGPPYDLDPATWVKKAANPQGVFITAPDAKYWLTWPQPDGGFTNVYVTDNLNKKVANGQWFSLPVSATGWLNVAGTSRMTVVNQSALNAVFSYTPTNSFFGLYHP